MNKMKTIGIILIATGIITIIFSSILGAFVLCSTKAVDYINRVYAIDINEYNNSYYYAIDISN